MDKQFKPIIKEAYPFPIYTLEMIKDPKIREQCEYAAKNKKTVLFLFEQPDTNDKIIKKINDPDYLPIDISHLKQRETKIEKSFYLFTDQMFVIYDHKEEQSYALALPLTKKDIEGILMKNLSCLSDPVKMLIMNDNIYLIDGRKAYDVRKKARLRLPLVTSEFLVYPEEIDKMIPFFLTTQEYAYYSIVPCYIDFIVSEGIRY